jgi:hypothetical protein
MKRLDEAQSNAKRTIRPTALQAATVATKSVLEDAAHSLSDAQWRHFERDAVSSLLALRDRRRGGPFLTRRAA